MQPARLERQVTGREGEFCAAPERRREHERPEATRSHRQFKSLSVRGPDHMSPAGMALQPPGIRSLPIGGRRCASGRADRGLLLGAILGGCFGHLPGLSKFFEPAGAPAITPTRIFEGDERVFGAAWI